MNPLCIFIVVTNTLLKQSTANLLSNHPDLTVVTRQLQEYAGGENSVEELVDEIAMHNPNVIVLENGTHLSSAETVGMLLMLYPGLRVIVLSRENNWLQVFSKEEVLMTQAADLIDLIHSV